MYKIYSLCDTSKWRCFVLRKLFPKYHLPEVLFSSFFLAWLISSSFFFACILDMNTREHQRVFPFLIYFFKKKDHWGDLFEDGVKQIPVRKHYPNAKNGWERQPGLKIPVTWARLCSVLKFCFETLEQLCSQSWSSWLIDGNAPSQFSITVPFVF